MRRVKSNDVYVVAGNPWGAVGVLILVTISLVVVAFTSVGVANDPAYSLPRVWGILVGLVGFIVAALWIAMRRYAGVKNLSRRSSQAADTTLLLYSRAVISRADDEGGFQRVVTSVGAGWLVVRAGDIEVWSAYPNPLQMGRFEAAEIGEVENVSPLSSGALVRPILRVTMTDGTRLEVAPVYGDARDVFGPGVSGVDQMGAQIERALECA